MKPMPASKMETIKELSKEAFIIENFFQIADKDGNDVPFILNSAQRKVDAESTGRDLIPKARQEGVSSFVLAKFTAKCLGIRNTRAVVISHEAKATERMLAKVHYYLSNFKGPAPQLKTSSKNSITFPKTNSQFYIGTAGAVNFGRGDTITDLHCSEVAFWPDPRTLTAGLFQAVPKSGQIYIESTGNGAGTWYHNMCMRAAKASGRYNLIFLPWNEFDEYQSVLTNKERITFLNELDDSLEEPELYAAGMSIERLAWRREKLEELDYDLALFKTEYPQTLEEAFQLSGTGLFSRTGYTEKKKWTKHPDINNFHYIEGHPSPFHQYIIGIDTAAGLGRTNPKADYSVAEIFSITSQEQVGEWISNKISPTPFASICAMLGTLYNKAFLVPELNNHGILVVSELLKPEVYGRRWIYNNKLRTDGAKNQEATRDHVTFYGFQTKAGGGPNSRFAAFGRLRTALASKSDPWTIYSPILRSELTTIIENPDTGKLEAAPGCHDDTVLASMCAIMGIAQAIRKLAPPKSGRIIEAVGNDPFQLDNMLDEISNRGNSLEMFNSYHNTNF